MRSPTPLSPETADRVHFAASEAAKAGTKTGYGSSLGTSLAVHGVVVATLVMTLRLPFVSGNGDGPPADRTITAHIERAPAPLEAEPVEVLGEIEVEFDDEPLILPIDLPGAPSPFDDADTDHDRHRALKRFDRYAPPTFKAQPKTPPRPSVAPRVVVQDQSSVEPKVPTQPAAKAPKTFVPDRSPSPIAGACAAPVFPKIADRRGWFGTVHLSIDVAADGTVSDVRVDRSSGHKILDDAALRAVRDWRFAPAMRGGVPAGVTVRKPIEFKLNSKR